MTGQAGRGALPAGFAAGALPRVREVVIGHLAGPGLSRDRVLAVAIRLIDLGFFRPDGQEYAAENGTYGLATIRRGHVTCSRGQLVFDYTGKSAKHREQAIADAPVCAVIRSLKRRRDGGDGLLAYRSGPRWHDVTAAGTLTRSAATGRDDILRFHRARRRRAPHRGRRALSNRRPHAL
jgi:DNA topoisomerase IB